MHLAFISQIRLKEKLYRIPSMSYALSFLADLNGAAGALPATCPSDLALPAAPAYQSCRMKPGLKKLRSFSMNAPDRRRL